jgi:hypothetical protein
MGIEPGKDGVMFGRMMASPVVKVSGDANLQSAISLLLRAAERAEIVRWIEFPDSVLVFLLVRGDPESGAVYIMDRKIGTWYSVDFDDKQYGGYSLSQLEQLLKECHFLDLAEHPGLWSGSLNWYVEIGKPPEARV